MAPGFGYMLNTFYDVTRYVLRTKKLSLKVTQCFIMAILIANFLCKYLSVLTSNEIRPIVAC